VRGGGRIFKAALSYGDLYNNRLCVFFEDEEENETVFEDEHEDDGDHECDPSDEKSCNSNGDGGQQVQNGAQTLRINAGSDENMSLQGETSMVCPLVSGIATYVKSIKSSLMTIDSTLDPNYMRNKDKEVTSCLSQIDLVKTIDAGLIYDININFYIDVFYEATLENDMKEGTLCSPHYMIPTCSTCPSLMNNLSTNLCKFQHEQQC